MKTVDWIVVGGGIAGAAIGYELSKVGFSVLLLEQDAIPRNATRYSYGGVAYWSGTTELTRQVCQEGLEIHRNLSDELNADTQFRELDLLMPIALSDEPDQVAAIYSGCATPPKLISAEAAYEIEPLLKQGAIAAALYGKHGHVEPELITKAYIQAMLRLGGLIQTAQVVGFHRVGDRVQGVITSDETYLAANVVVAAGGLSRAILQSAGVPVRCYFTQAELIETPPVEMRLRSLITPAVLKRFQMEGEAGKAETDALWNTPDHEVVPSILDAGAVQFVDGRLRIGQISRTLTDPTAKPDAAQSEADIRHEISQLLPALKTVPGQWHSCLVAFSGDRLPLIGALSGAAQPTEGLHIFSGFSNPFAILPPLARRFARHLAGQDDTIISQLSPNRFN